MVSCHCCDRLVSQYDHDRELIGGLYTLVTALATIEAVKNTHSTAELHECIVHLHMLIGHPAKQRERGARADRDRGW